MRLRRLRAGDALTIALKAPARVHWGVNGWKEIRRRSTRGTPASGCTSPTFRSRRSPAGETIQFTFLWLDTQTWEGEDYEIEVTTA